MRFFFRFILTAVGLVLIALAVGVILMSLQSGPLIRYGLERSLSRDLGTQVQVEAVRVRPGARSVVIENIRIAAPGTPLRDASLMTCGHATVALDLPASLTREGWVVSMALDDVVVYLDRAPGALVTLRKAVESLAEPRQGVAVQSIDLTQVTMRLDATRTDTNLMVLDPFRIEAPDEGRPLAPAAIAVAVVRAILGKAGSSLLTE